MDEFEARLRTFKPRRPGPLPKAPSSRPAVWLLAAAAVIAAAVAVAVALGTLSGRDVSPALRHSPPGVVQDFRPVRGGVIPTVGSLTPLALNDPRALDVALDHLSETLLPDVELPNHALSALGRNAK